MARFRAFEARCCRYLEKIGFAALREEGGPCALERGAARLEIYRGAVAAVARIAAWMEAAVPDPGIGGGRVARMGQHRKRFDVLASSGLARSEGFEPPTLGIEIRCSIQLSYERVEARLAEFGWKGQPSVTNNPGH